METIDEIITSELGGIKKGGELYNIYGKKPEISFTIPQKKAIKLLANKEKEIIPFGSFMLRAQKYPADIDLAEEIKICKSKEDTIKEMKKIIDKIIKRIKNQRGIYLGDVKIGLDKVFMNINIGKLKNGEIYDYNYNYLINKIEELYDKNYITEEEYDELEELIKEKPKVEDINKLSEYIRNKYILRWKENELIRGYKILPPNRKVTIKKALEDKTMIKIDIWIPIYGRYIEATNFYILEYLKNGECIILNLPENYLETIEENLKYEVEKLYYNNVFFKPFKLVKRMFAMGRLKNDKRILNKLFPIISSDASLLSQINSEIEVIISILEKIKRPPYATLEKQIDNFKNRISNITEIKINEEAIDEDIDYIVEHIGHYKNDIIIEKLKKIKKYFTKKINEYTMNYLRKVKLIPPPRDYLPKELKYKYNIYK